MSYSMYGSIVMDDDLQEPPGDRMELRTLKRQSLLWKRAWTSSWKARWLGISLVAGLVLGVITTITVFSMNDKDRQTQGTGTSGETLAHLTASGNRVETPPDSKAQAMGPRGPPSQAPLSFIARNFYHVRDGKPGQDYPWLNGVKLIEPHRETTLTVANPRLGFEYIWNIGGDNKQNNTTMHTAHTAAAGVETTVLLTTLDENIVTLLEVDVDGTVARRLEETVMVKYVRREIRTLTEGEREELLDAMNQLWKTRVDGGDGRELYGDDYSDIWAINRLHFKAASPGNCDHFHNGLGFLTSHAILTNTFEYSLQRVNPKLTVPYWDFTVESSSAESDGGHVDDSQIKSPLFATSWFGTSDPVDHMVKDGRWGKTAIPEMRANASDEIEADVYGRLRAPWNVNDRAYITRGMGKICGIDVRQLFPWPTCDIHYDLVTRYSDFASWVWFGQHAPHGPVHAWIGGVMDCEATYGKLKELVGESSAHYLALYSPVHRRGLFNDGYFKCEGKASADQRPDEVFSSGLCGCLDYDLSHGDDYKDIYESVDHLDDIIGAVDVETKRQLVYELCTATVTFGGHYQASSSLDPSFWPMHPTMDRLWQFSVLTGRMTDFSWPDEDSTYTKSDGTTVSESLSVYSDTCLGHGGSDVFPFGLLENDPDNFALKIKTGLHDNPATGNTLSNRDVLRALDPRSSGLPYIYDTFKWKHCLDDGFNFDDAWGDGSFPAGERVVFENGAAQAPLYSSVEKWLEQIKAERRAGN